MSARTRRLLIAACIVVWGVLLVVAIATPGRAATPPVPPSVVATKSDPDQTGVRASAYTGRYYRAGDEGYRRCIVARESNGHYFSTGRNGYYQGAYQATNALIRGGAWMMTDELREMFPRHWRVIRDTLLETPGHRWSRFYQDMFWSTVVNWQYDHRGAFHWSGGRWSCVPGMVWRGAQ